ncbi:MAG: response regulator [Acidiferrobacterales bacterium]|nr:response regulator [Acidiferrobacterales bacterium]
MVIKSSKILVVDDEPANLRLVEKILHSAGYLHVELVNDSRKAVDAYLQQESDLILLDLNMPNLDGYEVMQKLQALNQEVIAPIMVLTAQQAREFRIRALDLGARDFICKPFDQIELLARVRNLLQAHRFEQSLHARKGELERLVQERTRELHDTRLQIVRKLGRAAEFRDNETGNHIIRMSKIAALLAQASGMNEYECDLLLNAAPMHDIGKIGIPDRILLKNGKFDPEEWGIMKTHTLIGADILAGDDSEVLKMAESIALTHHEKWDGTGYPAGLAGEAIPLVGRITAIADVFDALTSERPYKHAWPVSQAVEYIKAHAGTHFDPDLAAKFLDLMPQIQQIINEYFDPADRLDQLQAM